LFDGRTQKIGDDLGLEGLYGTGIAFPETWTDPEGFEEKRVGFNRHMEILDQEFRNITTSSNNKPSDG